MTKEKVRIGVHLTEEENKNLKCYAADCGLSVSAFMEQLCKGISPRPKPQKEFWELLNVLYELHSGFKQCAKYESSELEICKEIEQLILDLQTEMTVQKEWA